MQLKRKLILEHTSEHGITYYKLIKYHKPEPHNGWHQSSWTGRVVCTYYASPSQPIRMGKRTAKCLKKSTLTEEQFDCLYTILYNI